MSLPYGKYSGPNGDVFVAVLIAELGGVGDYEGRAVAAEYVGIEGEPPGDHSIQLHRDQE